MTAMTLERPAPPAGEWNHECTAGTCGNCGNPGNVLEPLTGPAAAEPDDDISDYRNPATV